MSVIKTYRVCIRDQWLGDYQARTWTHAADQFCLDYATTLQTVRERFGAYPVFEVV